MILDKKVALVTGSAKGIGRQIAMDMAREGAKVILCDISQQAGEATLAAITANGGKALFVLTDVSKQDDLKQAANIARETFGCIDIVVANASITSRRSFLDLTVEEWERTIKINLTGTFLTIKTIIPQMVAQGHGKIIVISSASAITGSGGGAHYATTKGGQNSMVRNLARVFGPDGITANAIAPRTIETEILDELYPPGCQAREDLITAIPVRRLGKPDDIAELAVFLASDKSNYINGQIIVVDGGRTYA
jgi:3-oxoacyl-[acyl-carrier protein] reductase